MFDGHRWLTTEFNPLFNQCLASFKGGKRTYFRTWNGDSLPTVDHDENWYIKSVLETRREELDDLIRNSKPTTEIMNWVLSTSQFIQGRGQSYWEIADNFETNAIISIAEFIPNNEVKEYMGKYVKIFKNQIMEIKKERETLQTKVENIGKAIATLQARKDSLESEVKELEKKYQHKITGLEASLQAKKTSLESEVNELEKKYQDEITGLGEKQIIALDEFAKEIQKEKENLGKIKNRRKTAEIVDKLVSKIFGN